MASMAHGGSRPLPLQQALGAITMGRHRTRQTRSVSHGQFPVVVVVIVVIVAQSPPSRKGRPTREWHHANPKDSDGADHLLLQRVRWPWTENRRPARRPTGPPERPPGRRAL